MALDEDYTESKLPLTTYLASIATALSAQEPAKKVSVANAILDSALLKSNPGSPIKRQPKGPITEETIKTLTRIAPAINRAQLREILSNIQLQLSEQQQYELLNMSQQGPSGSISRCDRCKQEIYSTTSCSILAICNTVDEKTVGGNAEDKFPRFASLAAKRIISPCKKCLEENSEKFDLKGSCQCLGRYVTPQEGNNEGRHCETCFEDLKEEMKEQNTCEMPRADIEHGTFSLLDYQCDCGRCSSPYTARICRLCRKTCRPYTLNKDNKMLRSTFEGTLETSMELTGTGLWGDNQDYWTNVGDEWDNGFCDYFVKHEYFNKGEKQASGNDADNAGPGVGEKVDEDICAGEEDGGEVVRDGDHK
ncbi:uncharacterized protein PAC_12478 [Phialocephala subalpina]|uniref:Uncharacterized protein n=1 Tax=Phialocephala subalpina TaxID=576137 RepID=A0A1L7XC30_9HELO|nr:uncharacterized protein PAC_12478 [Phialocephala subalpina]